MKSRSKQGLKATLFSLGFSLVVVLGIRSSVVEAYQIPSGSMMPTLLVGDKIFVNKFSYGIRVPFTDYKFLADESHYLFRTKGPSHGDIIVFRHPIKTDTHLIKRVIGIPGDIVEMKNKVVYVNGKEPQCTPVTEETRNQILNTFTGASIVDSKESLQIYQQHFEHTDGINMTDSNVHYSENFGPITVPTDQYFCMGDNRDNSDDSRFWGFVPFGNIQGRAFIAWLSFDLNLAQQTVTFRPERIGKVLN